MQTRSWTLFSAVLMLSLVSPASAALLVYEGFDVTGGVNGSSLTGKAGATSVGFDSGSSWTDNSTGTGTVTYETTGLTFSDLVVIGGRSNLNVNADTADTSRPLDVAATGSVYGSFLVNLQVAPASTSISSVLVGSQAVVTTNDSGSQFDFQANADVYLSTLGGGRLNGAHPSGSFTNTGTALSAGTTYLALYQYDGLTASGPVTQTLTTWILTAAQFDAIKSGGITASELNSATVTQKGTLSGSFSSNLTNADYLHLFGIFEAANGLFDELRLSNASLDEVIPLVQAPEPSALALLFCGSFAMMRLMRRRGKVRRAPMKAPVLSIVGIGLAAMMTQIVAASPVSLQNATATFSQGGLLPAQTIDGNTGASNGWAIYDFDSNPSPSNTSAQTIVWEAASDVSFGPVQDFTFTIYHNFVTGAHDESLGRFRLSVTTANRSSFADGVSGVDAGALTVPGDVGLSGIWTVLTPTSFTSTLGTDTYTVLGDNSILVGGPGSFSGKTYTITATIALSGITGFRLEAIEDASLPTNGPGRSSDGNFVLSEFTVNAVPEPSAIALLLSGSLAMMHFVRRRGK